MGLLYLYLYLYLLTYYSLQQVSSDMAIIRYCNKIQSIWQFNCSFRLYKRKLDLIFTQRLEVHKNIYHLRDLEVL